MRTKTKYREIQLDNSAQNIPAEKELPVTVVSAPPQGPAMPVESQPQVTAPEPIPAAEALKAQLEALKHSEEIQRQRAAHIAASQQQPVTREQKLRLWKQQGLSAGTTDEIEYRVCPGEPVGAFWWPSA